MGPREGGPYLFLPGSFFRRGLFVKRLRILCKDHFFYRIQVNGSQFTRSIFSIGTARKFHHFLSKPDERAPPAIFYRYLFFRPLPDKTVRLLFQFFLYQFLTIFL